MEGEKSPAPDAPPARGNGFWARWVESSIKDTAKEVKDIRINELQPIRDDLSSIKGMLKIGMVLFGGASGVAWSIILYMIINSPK